MSISNVKFGGIDLAKASSITLNGNKKVTNIKLNGSVVWPLPKEITSIDTPQLMDTEFTYSGNNVNILEYLSPLYDESTMCIVEPSTTSALDVGTYTFAIKPNDGYCWEDGSTSPIYFSWEIISDDSGGGEEIIISNDGYFYEEDGHTGYNITFNLSNGETCSTGFIECAADTDIFGTNTSDSGITFDWVGRTPSSHPHSFEVEIYLIYQ